MSERVSVEDVSMAKDRDDGGGGGQCCLSARLKER